MDEKRSDLIRNLKWCIDNKMPYIMEVFINSYENYIIDEYYDPENNKYEDGYDDGYRNCMSENSFTDEDDMDYDSFRERFQDYIEEEIYERCSIESDESYSRGYSEGERAGYDRGYEYGEREGRDSGYEDGKRDGFIDGYEEAKDEFGE
jgi:flagellar biosynthesis/type III secretory pathway protein FliH